MSGIVGLRGRAVLVTGGASGIGRAIALRLGDEGAAVAIFDLNEVGAKQTADTMRGAGARAVAKRVDITDGRAVERAVAEVTAELGPLDGLVNNAGWDEAAPFLDTDIELWRKVIDINLYGPLHVTKAVLSRMAERGRGRIVSIASDAGRVGSSGEAVYSACKGGIIAFTKSLAREVARRGITLNVVSPGPTDTPLFASVDPSGRLQQALERTIPMKRLAQPTDYAGMVAFLLSDEAAYITGQTISVSGGLTMS